LPIGDEGSNDQANGAFGDFPRILAIRALRTHFPAKEGTSVFLSPWVRIGIVAGCCLLISSTALASSSSTSMTIAGSCAGDTVSGRVDVRAPRGTLFTLRLLREKTARSSWAATGKARRFKSNGQKQTLRFRFDVSRFDAYAYRLRLARGHRRAYSSKILATACAPGEQVPESPLSILLPLSLLGTSGLLLLRRRRTS
jgi:hypothetical protein